MNLFCILFYKLLYDFLLVKWAFMIVLLIVFHVELCVGSRWPGYPRKSCWSSSTQTSILKIVANIFLTEKRLEVNNSCSLFSWVVSWDFTSWYLLIYLCSIVIRLEVSKVEPKHMLLLIKVNNLHGRVQEMTIIAEMNELLTLQQLYLKLARTNYSLLLD